MFLGGGCALLGYWLGNRSVERLGYMLIGAAATVYAIGVIIVFGWQGVTTGILYIGIALSKLVRLLVGSAVRNAVIRAGRHPHGWTPAVIGDIFDIGLRVLFALGVPGAVIWFIP
jgi:hypothetical protein